MVENAITIRIGGEAGMGLESSGAGFGKALVRGGLYVFGVPDFYSAFAVGTTSSRCASPANPSTPSTIRSTCCWPSIWRQSAVTRPT